MIFLHNVPVVRVNQAWSVHITYIRLKAGFAYLVAIIDLFGRYVASVVNNQALS